MIFITGHPNFDNITRSYNYSLQFIIQFRCFHEHLDLFTEIKDRNVESLIKTPFGGRYCGKIPPRPRISLYKVNAILQNDVKSMDIDNFT